MTHPDPDPLHVPGREPLVCVVCHEPSLASTDRHYHYATPSERHVMDTWRRAIADEQDDSHLGAIVVIAAVIGLSVIVAVLLLAVARHDRTPRYRRPPLAARNGTGPRVGISTTGVVERLPDTATSVTGTASWYCGAGSRCTRGYPGGLYAAAGPALRVGDWRGRRVTVCSGGRCVNVKLIDFCACAWPGHRPVPRCFRAARLPVAGRHPGHGLIRGRAVVYVAPTTTANYRSRYRVPRVDGVRCAVSLPMSPVSRAQVAATDRDH